MPTMREIAKTVAERHGLTEDVMWRRSRRRPLALARQEAFHEMLKNGYTTGQIGGLCGLCHTTILHGAAQHSRRAGVPPATKYDIEAKLARVDGYHKGAAQ